MSPLNLNFASAANPKAAGQYMRLKNALDKTLAVLEREKAALGNYWNPNQFENEADYRRFVGIEKAKLDSSINALPVCEELLVIEIDAGNTLEEALEQIASAEGLSTVERDVLEIIREFKDVPCAEITNDPHAHLETMKLAALMSAASTQLSGRQHLKLRDVIPVCFGRIRNDLTEGRNLEEAIVLEMKNPGNGTIERSLFLTLKKTGEALANAPEDSQNPWALMYRGQALPPPPEKKKSSTPSEPAEQSLA